MTTSIFRDYIINTDIPCVPVKEFYRAIFAEGELQKKGVRDDGKYNALIQIGKEKFIYLHDELDSLPDYETVGYAKTNFIAYAGQTGEDDLARELHAFAVRVNFPERMGWQDLFTTFHRQQLKGTPKINPTYVLNEGDRLVFVYVLADPIPMYKKYLKKLKALNTTLSRVIHEALEADCFNTCTKPMPEGLYVRYAVVDTVVNGELCCAYETGGGTYTLDDINALVPKAQRVNYHKSKATLAEAKELWPNWYNYRIEQGRKPSGRSTWDLKEGAYKWFLDIVMNSQDIIKPGVLQALACYAVKAGIDEDTLLDDMTAVSVALEHRIPSEAIQHHYDTAIQLYEEERGRLMHWSLKYIEKLSGLTLPRNKRNYRTRKEHLTIVHKAQSKKELVRQWKKEHPKGTRAECARDLGITWNTADKWWSQKKKSAKNKDKPAAKTYKAFDCGCGNPDIQKSTHRWFYPDRGNFYKRTMYTCKSCECVHMGKARIDNSQ